MYTMGHKVQVYGSLAGPPSNNLKKYNKFTWIVYLHSANVFHNLIVLSRLPETIWRLSAENATLNTS